MKISVAMATCNGQRWIEEQLASIAAQRRPPDEIIVHDDASEDNTAEIMRTFARRAGLPVQCVVHPRRVGTVGNFASVIAACHGDVIVLSDQDDRWAPEKLLRLEQAFADPHVVLAFSDAALTDDMLRPLHRRLWRSIGFSAAMQQRMEAGDGVAVQLRRYVVTGATCAFRADLRRLVLPIPDGWAHDAWIGLLAAAVGKVVPIRAPLIEYRQHARQQVGGRRKSFAGQMELAHTMDHEFFLQLAAQYEAARARLAPWEDGETQAAQHLIGQKVAHCRVRAALHLSARLKRIGAVLREMPRYGKYSQGWKAVLQDLVL